MCDRVGICEDRSSSLLVLQSLRRRQPALSERLLLLECVERARNELVGVRSRSLLRLLPLHLSLSCLLDELLLLMMMRNLLLQLIDELMMLKEIHLMLLKLLLLLHIRRDWDAPGRRRWRGISGIVRGWCIIIVGTVWLRHCIDADCCAAVRVMGWKNGKG